jgi:hypothetical protein
MQHAACASKRLRHHVQVPSVGGENFVVVGGFLTREINTAQVELPPEVCGDQGGDVTSTTGHYQGLAVC